MTLSKTLLRCLAFVSIGILVALPMACKTAEPVVVEETAPVFFPSPPSTIRLQFLKSFARPEDVNVEEPSAFETFLLGEPEKEDFVVKTYGVDIHDGKIYACDIGKCCVVVMDVVNNTYGYYPLDPRAKLPFNIFIEPDGTKYITDPGGGMVFVHDADDRLVRILAAGLNINPRDIFIKGDLAYITDSKNIQVVILNKITGEVVKTFGKRAKSLVNTFENDAGDFGVISDIAVDKEDNIYVSDIIRSQVLKFDKDGNFLRTFSGPGSTEANLIRPKGIALDREERIWVADSGPAEAVKIYDAEGRFLLFFGQHGKEPGQMFLPTKVKIDYDNVDLFKQYAVEGANLEYLVLVANQFGPNKINVYGFGTFPQ